MDFEKTEKAELEAKTQDQISIQKKQLLKDLNDLWASYLRILDSYMAARKDLSSSFMAGYFSLAQANYASRTRFGTNYYDERVQAVARVKIEEDRNDKSQPAFTLSTYPTAGMSLAKWVNECYAKEQGPDSLSTKKVDTKALKDPLSMFGLLIPPPLRTAQDHFANSIHSITNLCDLAASLKFCESKILLTRENLAN